MAVSPPDPSEVQTKRQRVPALSPDERRGTLIAATIPLLREHGMSVSTRQIADAAGVAEGTIFGVFKDKASLIDAAITRAFEPGPVLGLLRAIDPNLDLRARMVAAANILRENLFAHGALLNVLRAVLIEGNRAIKVDLFASRHLILYEVAVLIEPDAHRLRRTPSTTAQLLMSLVAQTRDGFGALDLLDGDEIVSLLLDGLLVPDPQPETRELPC